MKSPKHISEIILEIASDKNDPCGQVLRQIPFIQDGVARKERSDSKNLPNEQAYNSFKNGKSNGQNKEG